MSENNNRGGTYRNGQEDNGAWWKILLAVIVAAAILGGIIALVVHNKNKDEGVTDPAPSAVTTTTNTTSTTTNPDELDSKGSLGALTVEIKSHKLVKDENGKDAIVITYEIENGGSAVMNFLTFLSDSAYQGDKKLSDAVLKDVEGFNGSSISEDLEPNAKREVTRAFVLSDTTTPVKAIVKELVTTDDRVITRTFEIK
ncbi:MAG: DUF5067 domain-containing protein [Clostridium sp.]|jgi:hypothetical protein|nr:DUF5067 domain-containing protein [Clostridium sp.]